MSIISLPQEIEKKIIENSRNDKKHFGQIYKHYKDHIYKFFYYRVNDKVISDDLTSIVFEKALKGLDNFQWQGVSFSAWLYRIARNQLIDYYRKTDKRNATTNVEHLNSFESKEKTPEEKMEEMFAEDLLYQVLKQLPSREREIIYYKFFDGYTNRLIAEITGLSETNVGTIVYRTLRKLRDMYTSNG